MTWIFLVTLTTPFVTLSILLCYSLLHVSCEQHRAVFTSQTETRFFNFARRIQPHTLSILIYTFVFIPTITFCKLILLTFVCSNTFIPPIYIVTLDPNYLKFQAPHLFTLTCLSIQSPCSSQWELEFQLRQWGPAGYTLSRREWPARKRGREIQW